MECRVLELQVLQPLLCHFFQANPDKVHSQAYVPEHGCKNMGTVEWGRTGLEIAMHWDR
jgi:hypothetical protein